MTDRSLAVDLSKYIETRLLGDRPHLRGRRIPISVIARTAADNGHGVSELMYDFDLSETEVLASLLYYSEHQASIEAQEAAISEEYKPFYGED
jgi:uncharacterized protein (DUF433 family)